MMTPEELFAELPNGLHDAEVRSFAVDWVARKLAFELTLWTATMDDPRGTEWYRPARLTFSGLEGLAVEPPQHSYGLPYGERDGFAIDAGLGQPEKARVVVPCSSEARSIWMFVQAWNAFILFSARAVDLEWLGPEYPRHCQ